jgi:hypothetical protein
MEARRKRRKDEEEMKMFTNSCAFQFIYRKSKIELNTIERRNICGCGATERQRHKGLSIGRCCGKQLAEFLLLILRLRNLQHKLIEVSFIAFFAPFPASMSAKSIID